MSSEKIRPECKFKVGDVVAIKEWGEMRAINNFCSYEPSFDDLMFVSPMRKLCGREATVKSIEPRGEVSYRLRFEKVLDPTHDWIIADWMVELVPQVEVPTSELIAVLGGMYGTVGY